MRKRLPLENDEVVWLRCSGALCLAPSGRWRLGIWICTNARVLFLQGGGVVFSTTLGDLISVELCEREYSFGKKPCLKNTYREKEGEPFDKLRAQRTFWLMTPDIEQWRLKLSERLIGTMPEADVARLAKELDSDAEELVWFLHRRRSATIGELAAKINAENHMDVLRKIRHEINPASEKLTGQPAFVFKQYKWWFAGDQAASEPFSDVIDEGDFYRVIVESPETARIMLDGHVLKVQTDEGLNLSITLPDFDFMPNIKKSYRNGVLELQITKASAG